MIALFLLSVLGFDGPTLADTTALVVEDAVVEADGGMRYPGIEALLAKFEAEAQ